jgi:hypothetical protein
MDARQPDKFLDFSVSTRRDRDTVRHSGTAEIGGKNKRINSTNTTRTPYKRNARFMHGYIGRVIINSDPAFSDDLTLISPPCAFIIS